MSYIVPMDKPNCFNCRFRTGDYCGILTENEKVKEYAERYDTSDFCPLVEIKKLHGRLIDDDTVTAIYFSDADGKHCVCGERLDDLEIEADTVIEAEGCEE